MQNGNHPTGQESRTANPLLSAQSLYKAYGGVRALQGASIELSTPGSVHALIGENGSGKSTMLSILSGQVRPDAGSIVINGEPVTLGGPLDALDYGIVMVSQETAVAPDLTVAENVLMGRLPRRPIGGVDWKAARSAAGGFLRQLGMTCDPTTLVRALRPDQRQLVEIARALAMKPRVLILDEPTSSLTDDEVSSVLAAIRLLKQSDVATILVSHRFNELFAVADEITILRDGRTVATGRCADYTSAQIVAAMLGDAAGSEAHQTLPSTWSRTAGARRALTLVDASGPGFADISLNVDEGEVVGLAGLVGSGRGDLLNAIFGVVPFASVTAEVAGEAYLPRHPRAAIAAGIGYVPPERKTDGLVLKMSTRDNIGMVATAASRSTVFRPRGRGFVPDPELVTRLRLRPHVIDADAGMLSGGNQQKVVIAKWLTVKPKLLMLAEPTRGVDVGSRAEIHVMLRELAEQGGAVLVSSSENPELLELCDRIIVMFGGRIVGTFARADIDEVLLAQMCNGPTLSSAGSHA